MNAPLSLIPADTVLLHSGSGSKAAIIAELLETLPSIDPDQALAVIMEREKLGSTGIGHGIAIPHGRLPDLETPITALARHSDGIDFDAIDGKPVHIVVVLLAPKDEDRSHLELLASLARALQKESVRQAIMAATTAEEISALFSSPPAATPANS
ncbi:MAG: PTS sugar transporter subunit IIA [Mariprofundaceae bacterium]|nr:PTS sugar transporter subunit IIA [Mariprofundaceae bacterium]